MNLEPMIITGLVVFIASIMAYAACIFTAVLRKGPNKKATMAGAISFLMAIAGAGTAMIGIVLLLIRKFL